MRVLFAGSPAIAVPSLEALAYGCIQGVELAGVLTNPDAPRGRSGKLLQTEVGEAALLAAQKMQLEGQDTFPVLKPEKLDSAAREQVSALKADLLISFAYGQFFGPKFMALFPLGGINIHPSLLPKYRGPTPVQAAILNGDTVTGITIQRLAQEMDCGDILMQEELQLTGRETAGALSEVISVRAAAMLPEVLQKIAAGEQGTRQDDSAASYCSLISRDDAFIDWKESAVKIDAKIRAFDPWTLCRTSHNSKELYILKASIFKGTDGNIAKTAGQVLGIDKENGILIQTGDGILAVTELQYSGKKALFWKDFLNGARDFLGSFLG
jgi:methionyl-tRNA formyltransferase